MFANYTNCGALFRQIRRRRQLTIHNVQGNLHKTAISYFENKNANIRLLNLMEILKPTFMEPQEFFELIDDSNGQLRVLLTKVSTSYKNLDLPSLRELLDVYDSNVEKETPQYMLKLVIVSCIANLEKKNRIFSDEEEERIQQFLLAEGPWFHFEYLIYANLCHSLSHPINDRILRHMLKKYREFHLSSYDEAFFGTFYNISARYLQDRDYERSSTMLDMISEFPAKHTALYVRHHVTFVRLVVSIHERKNQSAKTDLAVLLRATKLIDPSLYKMNIEWLKLLDLDPESLLATNV